MEERLVIPIPPDEFVKALIETGRHPEGDDKPEGKKP